MSNKENLSEITLNTIENTVDEIIFKSTTTILEDIARSVPITSVILGFTKAYTNYKTAKEQKQLLAFIQEADNSEQGFIEDFFQNRTNTELGFEVLGILDQTYLEKQARMIFRTLKLLKDSKITKLEFDKYTYIITKLDQYLISKIIALKNIFDRNLMFQRPSTAPAQPLEFVSFGFIERQIEPALGDEDILNNFKENEYLITDFFIVFYDNIFND